VFVEKMLPVHERTIRKLLKTDAMFAWNSPHGLTAVMRPPLRLERYAAIRKLVGMK